jgi:hypothetical protein
MKIQELQAKVDDVIKSLGVALSEVESIEASRRASQNLDYAVTLREKNIYTREVAIKKKEEDIEAQKKYIEEQNKSAQSVLNRITLEKEVLKGLTSRKHEIEQEREQLEADKKSFETLQREKDTFLSNLATFEKERKLFAQEKLALIEGQKLLAMREGNIKAKEERLDKIERMTEV